jgi:hypothetical protein
MNILLTANYRITEKQYGGSKTKDYISMEKYCINSFKKNLAGIDKIIVLSGEKEDYNEVFKEIFWKTREIFNEQSCNILWTDLDTLCMNPTSIFNEFGDFRLFYANEKTTFEVGVPEELYKDLNPWMITNLRYYPKSMSEEIWNVGERLVENWINTWAYECIVYNTMFHSQKPNNILENYHMPKFNVQYPKVKLENEIINGNIVHFHSSRGSYAMLDLMKIYTGKMK